MIMTMVSCEKYDLRFNFFREVRLKPFSAKQLMVNPLKLHCQIDFMWIYRDLMFNFKHYCLVSGDGSASLYVFANNKKPSITVVSGCLPTPKGWFLLSCSEAFQKAHGRSMVLPRCLVVTEIMLVVWHLGSSFTV